MTPAEAKLFASLKEFIAAEFSEEEAEIALPSVIDFAAKSKGSRAGKTLKCTPGKSYQCGGACISVKKQCKQSKNSTPGADNADAFLKNDDRSPPKGSVQSAPKTQKTSKTAKTSVALNSDRLKTERQQIADEFGEDLAQRVEGNLKKIVDASDIYIRVRSNETIEGIISEGRFKPSAEFAEAKRKEAKEIYEKSSKTDMFGDLITEEEFFDDDNDLFTSNDYDKRRRQAEESQNGIKYDSDPAMRPIYGYLGTDDYKSPHQESVGSNYGDIAIKLKPEAKARSSFQSGDSWRGAVPSSLDSPNAASALPVTSMKFDRTGAENSLNAAAEARDIDDYVKKANIEFLEVQVHNQVKLEDIAEIAWTKGQPSDAIVQWAAQSGVKLTYGQE